MGNASSSKQSAAASNDTAAAPLNVPPANPAINAAAHAVVSQMREVTDALMHNLRAVEVNEFAEKFFQMDLQNYSSAENVAKLEEFKTSEAVEFRFDRNPKISRVFLQAVLVEPKNWKPDFIGLLRRHLAEVENSGQQDQYPPQFLANLQLITHFESLGFAEKDSFHAQEAAESQPYFFKLFSESFMGHFRFFCDANPELSAEQFDQFFTKDNINLFVPNLSNLLELVSIKALDSERPLLANILGWVRLKPIIADFKCLWTLITLEKLDASHVDIILDQVDWSVIKTGAELERLLGHTKLASQHRQKIWDANKSRFETLFSNEIECNAFVTRFHTSINFNDIQLLRCAFSEYKSNKNAQFPDSFFGNPGRKAVEDNNPKVEQADGKPRKLTEILSEIAKDQQTKPADLESKLKQVLGEVSFSDPKSLLAEALRKFGLIPALPVANAAAASSAMSSREASGFGWSHPGGSPQLLAPPPHGESALPSAVETREQYGVHHF